MDGAPLPHLAAVAFGGAAGAVLRYLAGHWLARAEPHGFPWATFTVNAAGAFLLGLLLALAAARDWPPAVRLALGTGFLGALTTWSTFTYEIVTAAWRGAWGLAATYLALSLAVGFAACAAGIAAARALA